METSIMRQLRLLKYYVVASTIVFSAALFFAFSRDNAHGKFKEIDVERINIVEQEGKVRLVLSNAARQHPGIIGGKMLPARQREAGLVFFNDMGDECGGLVFDGNKQAAGMAISFDQFDNDQIMQLQYHEADASGQKKRSYGLKLWDRSDRYPARTLIDNLDSVRAGNNAASTNRFIDSLKQLGLLGRERLFVGKTIREEVGLFVHDEQGRPRIKIFVDKTGYGSIVLLDTTGKQVPMH